MQKTLAHQMDNTRAARFQPCWGLSHNGSQEGKEVAGSQKACEGLAGLGGVIHGVGSLNLGVSGYAFQGQMIRPFPHSPHFLKCRWGDGYSTWVLARGSPE